jgi:hypothetical protein
MEANVFLGYFEKGIAGVLSSFEHEQYPFDTLDQNNSAHGVYSVAEILLGFGRAMHYPFMCQKICYGA